jgi:protein TonB
MSNDQAYNDTPTLDEIVFENRNKEYGAYDLRKNYSRVLSKSFFIGGSVFLFLVLTPFIYLKVKDLLAPPKTEVKADLINIIQKDKILDVPKEVKPPPPPPPKDPPKQEVIQNVVPEPKVAPKIETPPPPIEKQLQTTTGLQNQEGIKTPAYTPPPPPPSSGKSNTAEVKPVSNEIYDAVDQSSEFPGGINAFRSAVSSNFDTSVMSGDEGNVKADITFVVEKDGSITQVKANGPNSEFNSEAERTIKGIRKKWTPAKVNGQAVRSRYRLPLTMQFAF